MSVPAAGDIAGAARPARVLIGLTSHGKLGETGRTTGFYVSEAAHPWQVLTAAGHQVELASVAGGEPPRDGFDADDAIQGAFLADPAIARQLAATRSFASVDPDRYDAVLFAGGHGTMWDFPNDTAAAALTRRIWEHGGIVAAVCHGPAALVNVTLSDGTYLVAGRDVAAFTDDEERAVGLAETVPFLLASTLAARGARHHPAPNFTAQVVRDGRLVTGQNPASAAGVAEQILAVLAEVDRRA
ncbi:type 1 glutamine amidotransferase domain-containing protein [Frankia sp. AgB1.9]|uniref:type 1 glutamine amidotransferase domain-containing protein n=1 Tax=unclassified Frankia TaxID=2632575 RepID=UPI0019329AAF|nr:MULTISPECIES: type 1 glutamine amidotransferase domain-containing protein [unclassified Frankia]MBL7486879.1 type 1 glutamine amidotransferase domain-containing protein [Frankia sp. AgW1.1]MBL7547234.1 type 1 glutamine amidotransferase domain-containing protein [Frankia sp. AgB1.9]MBL7623974.1 type 1 glutamine amidotransferase domain-containing protein [Frankia sp. AgB1.8]